MRLNQVTVGANDMPASVAFYETLGLKLIVLSGHYARFELPEGGSTFSLHFTLDIPRENAGVIYFECDDLDDEVARLKAAGIAFDSDPVDQSWLWREAHLRDPAGNAIILYKAGVARTHPPWRLPDDLGAENIWIVITERDGAGGLMLAKHEGDWRALQDRIPDFKTCLGPYRIDGAMAMVEIEWPEVFKERFAAMRGFITSESQTLPL